MAWLGYNEDYNKDFLESNYVLLKNIHETLLSEFVVWQLHLLVYNYSKPG